jgi:hypothetical protein
MKWGRRATASSSYSNRPPIADVDADLLEGFLAPARATMTPAEWDAEYGAGRALSQDQAATLLLTLEQ